MVGLWGKETEASLARVSNIMVFGRSEEASDLESASSLAPSIAQQLH